MTLFNKKLGVSGEDFAINFLKEKGYEILERNFRTKLGEIDIIAVDNDTLVFIEVKTRSGTKYGYPQQAVDNKKLEHIKKAGFLYINKKKNLPKKMRIEVVSIILENNKLKSMDLIKAV